MEGIKVGKSKWHLLMEKDGRIKSEKDFGLNSRLDVQDPHAGLGRSLSP
jgi:hypothetical protein